MPVFKCITALYFDVCPAYVFPCCISGDASRECVLCDARRVRNVLLPKARPSHFSGQGTICIVAVSKFPLSIMILLHHKKSRIGLGAQCDLTLTTYICDDPISSTFAFWGAGVGTPTYKWWGCVTTSVVLDNWTHDSTPPLRTVYNAHFETGMNFPSISRKVHQLTVVSTIRITGPCHSTCDTSFRVPWMH